MIILRSVSWKLLLAVAISAAIPSGLARNAAPAGAVPSLPDEAGIRMLVRNTLIALHQANVTGNYTVLRDLGTASLQAEASAARLAELFADFRERPIDLAPAAILDPAIDAGPEFSADGLLRLGGHVATSPREIVFDLAYRFERGRWRIAAVNAGLRRAAPAPELAPEAAPTPPPEPAPVAMAPQAPAFSEDVFDRRFRDFGGASQPVPEPLARATRVIPVREPRAPEPLPPSSSPSQPVLTAGAALPPLPLPRPVQPGEPGAPIDLIAVR